MCLEKDFVMKELLLFQVGSVHLALDLALIKSIQSAKTLLADQPEGSKRSARTVDGRKTHLYDLSAIFGQQTAGADSANKKLIIVKTDGYSLGLMVDGVGRVVSADTSRIKPLPRVFEGPAASCFPGVLKHEDRLFLILSAEGIADIARSYTGPQDIPCIPGNEDTFHFTETNNLGE